MVIWVAGTMFKDLGHSDGQITLATASVGIAWSLKPFWAAFLDMYRTKKFFVLVMEFLMTGLLIGVALALPLPNYFQIVIGILWAMAFCSSTQDICIDGIYITTLDKKDQAKYIGIQGTCWNIGRIFATAIVVLAAGILQEDKGLSTTAAWQWAMAIAGLTMGALGIYHYFKLPTGSISQRPTSGKEVVRTFIDSWIAFFKKDSIWGMLLFVFLYRSAEGLLLIEGPLFLQAPLEDGGLGLSLKEKGIIDGTISTTFSLAGGIMGGLFMAKIGLNRRSLIIMAFCLNIPHATFIYLSQVASPEDGISLWTISTMVTIEKFGYSFGFVANMLYMMQQISPGKYQMTHYAYCTALMNLMLIPTQAASGKLADWMGYKIYFIVVFFAAIPSIAAACFAPFPQGTNKPSEQDLSGKGGTDEPEEV